MTEPTDHVTNVSYDDHSGQYQAGCSCGWKGEPRWYELRAELDRRDHIGQRTTTDQVVAMLDGIDAPGETDHHLADEILLHYVPPEVREAYERVVERSEFWVYA